MDKAFLSYGRVSAAEQRTVNEVHSYGTRLRVALVLLRVPLEIWLIIRVHLTLIDTWQYWDAVASTKSLKNAPKGFGDIGKGLTSGITRDRNELAATFEKLEKQGGSSTQIVWKGIPVEQTRYNPVVWDRTSRMTMSTNNAHGVAWQSKAYEISFLNHGMIMRFNNGPKYSHALALSSKYLIGLEVIPISQQEYTYDWRFHVWEIENTEHYIANVGIQSQHLKRLDAKGETILLHIDEQSVRIKGEYYTTRHVYTHHVLSGETVHFTQELQPKRLTEFLLDHDGSSVLCFQCFEGRFTFVRYNFDGESQNDIQEFAWDNGESVLNLKMEVMDRKIIVFDEMERLRPGYDCTSWELRQLRFDTVTGRFYRVDRYINNFQASGCGEDSGFSNLLSPSGETIDREAEPFYLVSRIPAEVEGDKPRTALNLLYPTPHIFQNQVAGKRCECWRLESDQLQEIDPDDLDRVEISGNKTHIWIFHESGIQTFAKQDLLEGTRLQSKTDSRLLQWPLPARRQMST